MDFNFDIIATDNLQLTLIDTSKTNQILPLEIYQMELRIGSDLTNGYINRTFDLITYLKTARVENELFIIDSDILNLGENEIIPDGVYYFEITINNMFKFQHKFVVLFQVEKELKAINSNLNYNITVGDYDVDFVGAYADSDLEKLTLANALYNEIKFLALSIGKETDLQITDSLIKLKKILQILD